MLLLFICSFFTETIDSQEYKGRQENFLIVCTTSSHSRIFRHLFAVLQLRRLPCIFSRSACNYQAIIRLNLHLWEPLPPLQPPGN